MANISQAVSERINQKYSLKGEDFRRDDKKLGQE